MRVDERIRDGQLHGIIPGVVCKCVGVTQARNSGAPASASARVDPSVAMAQLPTDLTVVFASRPRVEPVAVQSWNQQRAGLVPEPAVARKAIQLARLPSPAASPVRTAQAFGRTSQGVRPTVTRARQGGSLSTADGLATDSSVHPRGQFAEKGRPAKSNVRPRRRTALAVEEPRRVLQTRSDRLDSTGCVCSRLLSPSRWPNRKKTGSQTNHGPRRD